jgi:thymidylate kinase
VSSTFLEHFVNALNEGDLPYCHWKSNYALAQAASIGDPATAAATDGAENDLDLLVDRKALPGVEAVLRRFHFKRATVKWGEDPQSIYHYYAFDPESRNLVHLHLFSSVITGESFVKSHLLPFERMLLAEPEMIGPIKVANRSAELVLFFVRNCIKYGSWLDLLYLRRNPGAVQAELAWLQAGSDPAQAQMLLQRYCPVIGSADFTEGLALLAQAGATGQKIRLAWRMRRHLRVYAKNSRGRHLAAYGALFWHYALRRLAGQRRNKSLASGGAVIAFVGPEATGKSTLVAESKRWLGDAFAVRAIHAGKPPSTLLTFPLNGLAPFLRKVLPDFRTNRLAGHIPPGERAKAAPPKIERLSALFYAVRAVAVAWDRRALLHKARRAAAQGELVICDRYPSTMVGAMDSPRLQADPEKRGLIPKIYNRLAQVEARLYQQIPPPDMVIKLSVSIATAQQRNRDRIKDHKESDAYVESRHRQVRNWQRPGTKYIYEISTEKSLVETLCEVKRVIWETL